MQLTKSYWSHSQKQEQIYSQRKRLLSILQIMYNTRNMLCLRNIPIIKLICDALNLYRLLHVLTCHFNVLGTCGMISR